MADKDTIGNLGLIGYILLLIGSLLGFFVFGVFIGFIGWLLVGIAWFLLGGWARAPSFKILGLIIILAPIIAVVVGIIGLFTVISTAISISQSNTSVASFDPNAFINGLISVIVIALEIYLVGEFFHVVAHYKAYRLLSISTFKYAMLTWSAAFISRALAVVLIIHAVASILPALISGTVIGENTSIILLNNTSLTNISASELSQELTRNLLGVLGSAMLAGIIGFVLGIIASILSMLAFNNIKNIVLEEEKDIYYSQGFKV